MTDTTPVDAPNIRLPWWRRLAGRIDLRLLPAAATVWLATLLGIDLGWVWTLVCGFGCAAAALTVLAARHTPAVRVAAWAVLVAGTRARAGARA